MQITVIAVGKIKEKYWKEALAEYSKRLSGYVRFEIQEVADEPTPDNPTVADREKVLRAEAGRIEKLLRDRDCIVALDLAGKEMSSEEWSRKYDSLAAGGYGRMVFIIGGSLGIDAELLRRAHVRWCFGPITMPHQMARVVLLEQIYRGIRILKGEPYHK